MKYEELRQALMEDGLDLIMTTALEEAEELLTRRNYTRVVAKLRKETENPAHTSAI